MAAKKKKAKTLTHRLTFCMSHDDVKLISALQNKLQSKSGSYVSWAKLVRLGILALAEREGINGSRL